MNDLLIRWSVLVLTLAQVLQVAQELFWSNKMWPAQNALPVLPFVGNLVGRAHLTKGGAADDKHNHAGKVLALGLLLVPVAEPGAVGSLPVHGALALAAQEWEVVVVELVVDGVFDNILA